MVGILDFLLPREKKFMRMLIFQSDILMKGAGEFNKFITHFNSFTKEELTEKKKEIMRIEDDGDRVIRDIIDALHETFITPIDREDIFNLAQSMEDALDFLNKITTKMIMYKARKMPKEMSSFSKSVLDCCAIIRKSLHHLRDYGEIKKAVTAIHEIEENSDRLFFRCMGDMFENHADVREIIKFKDIYESIEQAIDICKKIGDDIGQIVVKHG